MATLPIKAWIRIEDGNTEVDYVNVFPLHTEPYTILETPLMAVDGQTPTVTVHDSDDGPPEAINLEEENRLWKFTLHVTGDTPEDVSKNLSVLKMHVQGKQSTAYQAYRNGSQPDVVYRMQLTPSSPTTDFIIQYGSLEDNNSYYSTAALNNESAIGINVNLTCTPAGRGEVINLRNDIPSSPHFLEDSGAPAGLADGFSVLGTPSAALKTTTWLIGGKAQEITTDASTAEGFFMTNFITAAVDDPYVAYVWITTLDSTGDDIKITIQGAGSVQLDQANFDMAVPSGFDKTRVDIFGNTWYRYSFSHTGSPSRAAADLKIRVGRESGDATKATRWYTDGMYISVGTSIIPCPFSSTASIENSYDPSTGNESRINYLDVWNVPGDMPYELKHTLTFVNQPANAVENHYIATKTDGKHLAANAVYYWDSSDGFTPINGWSTVVDAATVGGSYLSSAASNTGISTREMNSVDVYNTFKSPVRVIAIMQVSVLGSGMFVNFVQGTTTEFSTTITTRVNGPDVAGFWQVVDLGVVNFSGTFPPDESIDAEIEFQLNASGTSGTVFFDGIYLLPTDSFTIIKAPRGGNDYFSAKNSAFVNVLGQPVFSIGVSGGMADRIPAQKTTRYDYLFSGDSLDVLGGGKNMFQPTANFTVSLEITPIASHLIGE